MKALVTDGSITGTWFPFPPPPPYFKMATNQSSRGCDIITTRFGGATTEVEWGKTADQWGCVCVCVLGYGSQARRCPWGGGGWPEVMVRGVA